MTLLGLLVMLMPLVALGGNHEGQQSQNCPDGYEEKEDPPTNIEEEWGTATLVNLNADGEFTAVEFFVKDGYTLEVCVKGGDDGFTEAIIVGEDTEVVSTPTNQEVSHYEWSFTFIAPTFDLEVEKSWTGDLGTDAPEGVTVTFTFDPGNTDLEEGALVTIDEEVEGELPEGCTYTSSPETPFDYTVDPEDADEDGLITLTVTNTVVCDQIQTEDVAPQLAVTKTASSDTAEPGDEVTFTVVISNPSATEPVQISSIVDSVFGTLDGDTDCSVGVTLAAGASCEFTFTWMVTEEDIGLHENIVEVIGVHPENELTVTASDNAEVAVDEVLVSGPITPSTPTTAAPVAPVTTAEVLDTQVEAEELPFTGIDSELLIGMAVLLLAGGLTLLGVTGRREDA